MTCLAIVGSLLKLKEQKSIFQHFDIVHHLKQLAKPRFQSNNHNSSKTKYSNTSIIDGIKFFLPLNTIFAHMVFLGGLLTVGPMYLGKAKKILDLDIDIKNHCNFTARFSSDMYNYLYIFPMCIVCIDVFFALSGFLQVYAFLTHFKSESPPSFISFVFKKWIRYSIVSLGVLTLLYFFAMFGDGPLFSFTMDKLMGNCNRNWWRLFLYVNNQHDFEELCLFPTWHLTVDMQIYVLSFFILKLMSIKPMYGILLAFGFMFIGMVYNGLIVYILQIAPFPMLDRLDME